MSAFKAWLVTQRPKKHAAPAPPPVAVDVTDDKLPPYVRFKPE